MFQVTWMPSLAVSWMRMVSPVTYWKMSTTCVAVKVQSASLSNQPLCTPQKYEHSLCTICVGSDANDVEPDEPTGLSVADDIDPFDFVYSNLLENTNILEQVANCLHCKAKRFERECPGFCCRNGQINLAEQRPIPELMSLWSSTDADS
jgi:hypothetical protein